MANSRDKMHPNRAFRCFNTNDRRFAKMCSLCLRSQTVSRSWKRLDLDSDIQEALRRFVPDYEPIKNAPEYVCEVCEQNLFLFAEIHSSFGECYRKSRKEFFSAAFGEQEEPVIAAATSTVMSNVITRNRASKSENPFKFFMLGQRNFLCSMNNNNNSSSSSSSSSNNNNNNNPMHPFATTSTASATVTTADDNDVLKEPPKRVDGNSVPTKIMNNAMNPPTLTGVGKMNNSVGKNTNTKKNMTDYSTKTGGIRRNDGIYIIDNPADPSALRPSSVLQQSTFTKPEQKKIPGPISDSSISSSTLLRSSMKTGNTSILKNLDGNAEDGNVIINPFAIRNNPDNNLSSDDNYIMVKSRRRKKHRKLSRK